jgi:3-hydroxybutyryl-CoA dehydrogenase
MNLDSIQTVAVLGLGTMGHGIAQTFAAAGYEVRGYDVQAAARASLHDRVRKNLQAFVDSGLFPAAGVEPTLARITACDTEQAAVDGVQFVTEAVAEDVSVKQALFSRVESLVAAETILASNSSTFPISQSGANLRRPDRAIVTHWFNPPHLVPLVEVVPSPLTNESTTLTTMTLMQQIGKQPLRLRKELPGFLVNRIQVALMREVWDLLDQGVASAEEIDAALRASVGFRLAAVGPLEVHDFGGLDIQTTVFRNLAPEIRSNTEVPALAAKLVAEGHLGAKTGRGFQDYPPAKIAARQQRRDALFLALIKLLYPETIRHA